MPLREYLPTLLILALAIAASYYPASLLSAWVNIWPTPQGNLLAALVLGLLAILILVVFFIRHQNRLDKI